MIHTNVFVFNFINFLLGCRQNVAALLRGHSSVT